jgi:hypothetical protein
MKKSYFLVFIILILACNNTSNKKNSASGDTTITEDSTSKKDASELNPILTALNKEILNLIKKKDYQSLSNHIHPTSGLRFTPYATVNLNNDVVVKPKELVKMMKDNDTHLFWGSYDGTGDPIDLTTKDYFAQFVYDADFLNAEKITINKSSAKGNSINNIDSIYPECDYVENYFSGFDKQYGGMDWRALRLVFQKEGERYYLVGIVHDQWTI